MEKQTISLSLTVEEVNMVLGALGSQPLNQVLNLWGNIKQQAESQLKQAPEGPLADKVVSAS